MFYFLSTCFDVLLGLALSVHCSTMMISFNFSIELFSWDIFFLIPKILFLICIWISLDALFVFIFQVQVSFIFANNSSCLECQLWLFYLIFLFPSLMDPLKWIFSLITLTGTQVWLLGCPKWHKYDTKWKAKSLSVACLRRKISIVLTISFQPQGQRKLSQHIQLLWLFS